MGWMTDDSQHEGWIGALFADGRIGGSSSAAGIRAGYDADGTLLPAGDDDEWRPFDAVIGWVGQCGGCQLRWRTEAWLLVDDPAEENLQARRVYADPVASMGDPPPQVEEAFLAEWRTHVRPHEALGAVADLAAEHVDVGRRLAAAVGRARAVGASWTDIGAAAGITRQSAHERWRNVAVPTPAAHGTRKVAGQ